MIRNSKVIHGIVYIGVNNVAQSVQCTNERVVCSFKDKSETNIVPLGYNTQYSEFYLQTKTATEDEAHALVTLFIEERINQNGYPDFTSKLLSTYNVYKGRCETALESLMSLLVRDNLPPSLNFIIVRKEFVNPVNTTENAS